MRTADELTAITIEFLAEHTNEAALAIALGVVWHLVWERPKHLSFLTDSVVQTSHQHEDAHASHANRNPVSKLRGNLRNELQLVLKENEELERIVQELRSEIESSNQFHEEYGYHQSYHSMRIPTTRKRVRNAGIIRTTIGMTTHELDALGSCWALLVFGYCVVSSRRRQKQDNPLSTTILLLEKLCYAASDWASEKAIPALTIIQVYFTRELRELYARVIDADSRSGRAIATTNKFFHYYLDLIVGTTETFVYDKMLPEASRLTKLGVELTHLVVNKAAALEMPKWGEEPPPTILLSEHEEQAQALENSLKEKQSKHEETIRSLEESLKQKESDQETSEQALKGKEVLLYEERMKTRSAKLEAAKVALEREETRRRESQDTKESALASIAEDQRRLLRGFLSEHILSRQQQESLRRIEEKNAPKKSTIVLPNPILQGFASAMYINNVSDLSSGEYTAPSDQPKYVGGDFPLESRDEAAFNDGDDYYANPNETRLRELKEQFLRSKTTANSLRPSHQPESSRSNNQASTGSLLWSAANPATKAKERSSSKQKIHQAVSQQSPSSWMADPVDLMCDWRMHENDDEVRE